MMKFPTEWKVIKFHGSKPPIRYIYIWIVISQYPLVNVYTTNWKDPPYSMGNFTLKKWWFSIAMLNYQRVYRYVWWIYIYIIIYIYIHYMENHHVQWEKSRTKWWFSIYIGIIPRWFQASVTRWETHRNPSWQPGTLEISSAETSLGIPEMRLASLVHRYMVISWWFVMTQWWFIVIYCWFHGNLYTEMVDICIYIYIMINGNLQIFIYQYFMVICILKW